ncbi:MAG: hypothetical protein AMXMBFR84_50460 [Candidatus Hydrogenedentota bacterium]
MKYPFQGPIRIHRRGFMAATGTILFGAAAEPEPPKPGRYLIAHRGVTDAGFKENSLAGLEEAHRRGYTHVEVDLRCTKDGEAVCLHDASLRRTAGLDVLVHDLSTAELYTRVQEERVPRFATYCEWARGRLAFQLDLKAVPEPLIEPFIESVQTSMRKQGLMDASFVIGRDELKSRFLGEARISFGADTAKAHALLDGDSDASANYYVFSEAKAFNAWNVAAFQKLGYAVIPSINTFHYPEPEHLAAGLADIQRMQELKVDGIQIDSIYDRALFAGR